MVIQSQEGTHFVLRHKKPRNAGTQEDRCRGSDHAVGSLERQTEWAQKRQHSRKGRWEFGLQLFSEMVVENFGQDRLGLTHKWV